MAQKIRRINFMCAIRRVAGNKELQGEEEKMNSTRLRIFAGCENFHNLKKISGIFCSSKTEHLQQNKTRNYKKLS